jgi:hypothetical protein
LLADDVQSWVLMTMHTGALCVHLAEYPAA